MRLFHSLKLVVQSLGDYLAQSELLDFLAFGLAQDFLSQPRKMGYERKPQLVTMPTEPWYPLPTVTDPIQIEGKVERHEADRAGTHLDLRFKINDRIYDFALPRTTELPKATGRVQLAVRRPDHTKRYFYTDNHVFPKGTYGAGRMCTVWSGHCDLIKSSPDSMEFYIPEGKFKGKYAIHNLEKGTILVRMKETPLTHRERMEFGASEHQLESAYNNPNVLAEQKIDGANYILRFGDKENTLVSRRLSVEGTPINRADNIPQLKYLKGKIAREFKGKNIHVEVVSYRGSVSETSGTLNQNPINSRQTQLSKPLILYVWDLETEGSYAQRRAMYRRLEKLSPKIDRRNWGGNHDRLISVRLRNPKLIQCVESNEDVGLSPKAYAERIKKRGGEGVVLKDKTKDYYGDVWVKDKRVETYDVKIIGAREGTGKYVGSLGALIVEDPTTGAVSRVGTGFTDAERQRIWDYHSLLINKKRPVMVEVDCHEVTKRGVLRGPRFIKFVNPEDVEGRIRIKEIAVAQYKRSKGLRR